MAEGTLRRHSHHALRVRQVVEETPDTRTFVFDVPDDLTDLFAYEAGQFCTVRIHVDGDDVSRCYSMSSAPALGEPLAFTVKRVPGGIVSNWLIDHVAAGDELELLPPGGVFCERANATPILAFCGGSGVTPVFSIVKQALASGRRPVRVFDANRDRESIIFADALGRLATTHTDRLAVRHHVDVEAGYPTAADIVEFVGSDTDADVYVCGPTPFMDLVESAVTAAGIPVDNVSIERFLNRAADDIPDDAAGSAPTDGDSPAATTTMSIRIRRKRHAVDYIAGDTILETARRAGLKPPSSCEQGNCATCMALVTSGGATMRANNALTDDEVAEGWVLTCQALPVGPDVAVEYDDL